MYKRFLKSAGAVFAGFITVAVLSIVTDMALEKAGVFPPPEQGLFIAWMLLLALFYRTVYTIFGGYLTSWLAPNHPMRHTLVLATIGTVTATMGAVGTWKMNLGPHWYPVALAVLAFPSVWLGGKIFEMRQKEESVE